MTKLELITAAASAARDPARIGDVAVYKAELSTVRGYPEVEAALEPVRNERPRVDLDAAKALPEGTFGRAYADFLKENKLSPIVPTDAVDDDMVARNIFTVRYAMIHDMVHVLLDFDTTWPGEAGVWAFVGGQRWSPTFQLAAWASILVAPFRTFRWLYAWRCWRRGWALGKAAHSVLPVRLETLLDQPLVDVRRQLGLPDDPAW